MDPNNSETANLEAGLNGLRTAGKKMTKLVLGVKLLQVLLSLKIGTGEVKSLALKRRQQRDLKLGFRETGVEKGDREHVCKLMEIR